MAGASILTAPHTRVGGTARRRVYPGVYGGVYTGMYTCFTPFYRSKRPESTFLSFTAPFPHRFHTVFISFTPFSVRE